MAPRVRTSSPNSTSGTGIEILQQPSSLCTIQGSKQYRQYTIEGLIASGTVTHYKVSRDSPPWYRKGPQHSRFQGGRTPLISDFRPCAAWGLDPKCIQHRCLFWARFKDLRAMNHDVFGIFWGGGVQVLSCTFDRLPEVPADVQIAALSPWPSPKSAIKIHGFRNYRPPHHQPSVRMKIYQWLALVSVNTYTPEGTSI